MPAAPGVPYEWTEPRSRRVFRCADCGTTVYFHRDSERRPDGLLICRICADRVDPQDRRFRCTRCRQVLPSSARAWPTSEQLRFFVGEQDMGLPISVCAACNTRGRYVPVIPAPRPCQHCGQTFTPKRSDGRFCSARCRVAHHRELARS